MKFNFENNHLLKFVCISVDLTFYTCKWKTLPPPKIRCGQIKCRLTFAETSVEHTCAHLL